MTTPSTAKKPAVRLVVTKTYREGLSETAYLHRKSEHWQFVTDKGKSLPFDMFFKNPLVTGFRLDDVPDDVVADDVLELCRGDALDDVTFEIFSGPRRPASDPYETAARAAGWDLRLYDDGEPYFITVSKPGIGLISDVDNGDWRTLCEHHRIVPVIDSAKGDIVTELYAALKKAEPVCDDAYHDAELELDAAAGENEHDRRVLTQNRDAAKAALDAVRAALARAEAKA